VDFLYSLYDALVSTNVPSDKARAVVDAMERDMGTTLATKHDLQPLASREDMLLLRQELQQLRHEMKGMATRDVVQQLRHDMKGLATRDEVQQLRHDMKGLATRDEVQQLRQEVKGLATRDDVQQLRQQVELQEQRLDSLRVELRKDMEALQLKLTVRLGGMIVAGFGLMIAAMSAAVAWLKPVGL